MSAPLLALLLLTPLEFGAGQLAFDDGLWAGEGGVWLRQGAVELRAERFRQRRDGACPGGRWQLGGGLTLKSARLEATADSLSACGPDSVAVRGLDLSTPTLRVRADDAELDGRSVRARGVTVTACGCADPPWRVTARSADITLARGAWASWPVFWAGAVPVAIAPTWYVPLGRRRSGLLLPRLGWDGEDGGYGEQPVFFALGRSADLTLAPGWRQGRGATASGALRWAASPHESGAVEARSILSEGVTLAGDGTLPIGPARFAIAGVTTTDQAARTAQFSGLDARRRDHLRGRISGRLVGPRAGVGGGATRYQTPSGTQPPDVAPDVWLRWRAPVGPADFGLHGHTLTLVGEGDPRTVADFGATFDATGWWGPLRLRPAFGAATTVHLDDGGVQHSGGWAGGEARVTAARRFGSWRHTLALALDARWARASERIAPPEVVTDRAVDSRALGATVETHLADGRRAIGASLRGGHEGAAPVEGFDAPILRAWADTPSWHLDAGLFGVDAAWGRARLGRLDGWRLRLGGAHLDWDARSPALRQIGPVRPLLIAPRAARGTTAEGGVGLPIGPLELEYDLVADVHRERILGHTGSLHWQGRCDCWSARAQVSYEDGRRAPDVWVSVSLGR